MSRCMVRRRIVEALDTLVNGRDWTGNVAEVWVECKRQGFNWASDYMIRQVLRDYGNEIRRGQYHVTSKRLTVPR